MRAGSVISAIAPSNSSACWAGAHRSAVYLPRLEARHDVRSLACVGGEPGVISHQVCPWARYQRRQTGDEVRGQQHVGGAIGERALEFEHDQAVAIDAQTLLGDGSSGHVTTDAFELGLRSLASQATAQLSENPSRAVVKGLGSPALGSAPSKGVCRRMVARPAWGPAAMT